MTTAESSPKLDFLRTIVADDKQSGRTPTIVTRFPPEPNGYLHIGHAKAICVDFGVAEEFDGRCHLRFDDTNPIKEEKKFADAMKEDLRWLGFDWGEHEYHASEYFQQLYEWAVLLIRAGKAYVDDQSADAIRESRGTLTEPGRASPFRDRPVEESLDLFERMKSGEFPDGSHVLRARIDMTSPNLNLRDPVMYRILHAAHPRTGTDWCIYPMYDWAHGQSDWIEGITHSLCSLEFEDHRPLYDWFIDQLAELGAQPESAGDRPRQIEFARLNLSHTIVTKRVLRRLVDERFVDGWDDPRMPTLAALRRRGYPAEAIRSFIRTVGLTKYNSLTDIALLEHAVREELNRTAQRRMGVLDPIKVIIENYPEHESELVDAVNNPENEAEGTRQVPFSRELYLEREDFMEDPPRKFFRLAPGREVRLRWAYFITCKEAIKDETGTITELRCTYDPATKGGDAPDGRKVKGTLHWVSAPHAVDAQVRLFDRLFAVENPLAEGRDITELLNPDSLQIINAKVEPSVADAEPGDVFQFERKGYFCIDSSENKLIVNRTVPLRDSWAKVQQRGDS